MSRISQCRYDIQRYNDLKSKINSICNYLISADNNCDMINSELINKYTINDEKTPLADRTLSLKNDINAYYNTLKNKVIPAIDNAINVSNSQIARLKREAANAAKAAKQNDQVMILNRGDFNGNIIR